MPCALHLQQPRHVNNPGYISTEGGVAQELRKKKENGVKNLKGANDGYTISRITCLSALYSLILRVFLRFHI